MRLRSVTVLLGALLAVTAARGDARERDELVIGMTQFPSTFHPSIDAMMAKTYVESMTRRPFTVYDANWELVCLLCTRMPSLENGLAILEPTPDGKPGIAVTYTIQPKATWGDGVPVTTRDVVFTWEVGRHPQSGVANMELYRTIWKIDARDDKTFTMHFDKVSFDYAGINDFQLLPEHLEAERFRSDPKAYRNRTLFDAEPTHKGLIFGPYRMTEVAAGSHVVLEPNPTWWGEKPFFRRIIVRAIENTAALEANVLSGAIDMVPGEIGFSLDQALSFEKRNGENYRILTKPGLVYEHIDLKLDNPILADVRVRRALLHGIDRNAINTRLFAGRQPPAVSFVNPLDWIFAEDIPAAKFDPDLARKLLDDAGWREIRKGVRQNAAGETLTLELMTTANNRSRELVEQVIQSDWKRIGVDARIRNQPPRVLFGDTLTNRAFPGAVLFAWISSPENVPRTTLHSKHIPTPANNFAGQNYTGYKSAEADDLIERMEVELDRDKRRALWARLQHIYADDLPAIPLFFRADSYILPKWLRGVEPTGHQYPTTLWIENWRAEP